MRSMVYIKKNNTSNLSKPVWSGKRYCISLAMILLAGYTLAQYKPSTGNDAVFNFTVTSKSGKPRQDELIILKSKKTRKTYKGNTGTDGKCSVTIPPSDAYTIYYKLFADTVKYKEIEVPGEDHRVTYTLTLKYDPPKVYTLKNVFFETGLSALRKDSYPALNELVDALKSKTSLCIEIAGHTDNVGTPESNQKLSTDRRVGTPTGSSPPTGPTPCGITCSNTALSLSGLLPKAMVKPSLWLQMKLRKAVSKTGEPKSGSFQNN